MFASKKSDVFIFRNAVHLQSNTTRWQGGEPEQGEIYDHKKAQVPLEEDLCLCIYIGLFYKLVYSRVSHAHMVFSRTPQRGMRSLAQGKRSRRRSGTLGKKPHGPRPTGARGNISKRNFQSSLLPRCLSLRPATFGSGRSLPPWTSAIVRVKIWCITFSKNNLRKLEKSSWFLVFSEFALLSHPSILNIGQVDRESQKC